MKKIVSLLLLVALVGTMLVLPGMAASYDEFPDAREHWSRRSIERWAKAGLVQGDPSGNVTPAADMTRAQFATLLTRLLGLKDDPEQTFNDLTDPDIWYASAVRACKAAGIMTGDQKGNCNANSPISRAEAMVMFARAMGLKEEEQDRKALNQFADGDAVPSWAVSSMATMLEKEILSGVGYGDYAQLDANENINRGSVFALLDKAIVSYISQPGEYTVNNPDRFVVINVPDGEVTVSGTAATVVITAGTAGSVTVSAQTETVKVDAPVKLLLDGGVKVETISVNEKAQVTLASGAAAEEMTLNAAASVSAEADTVLGQLTVNDQAEVSLAKGSAVTAITMNAAGTVTNKGSVGTLNVNVSGVKFSGTKPKKTITAEDAKAPTASAGGSSGGGSSGGSSGGGSNSPSEVYRVNVLPAEGGTITWDIQESNEGKWVTLTITPGTKNGLPYILRGIKVTNGSQDVAYSGVRDETTGVWTCNFDMKNPGTYNVEAHLVQPIIQAELFLVKDQESYEKLESYGYSSPNREYELTTLAGSPWLAFGVTKAEEFAGAMPFTSTLTANGNPVEGWKEHYNAYAAYFIATQGEGQGEGESLKLDGDGYTFVMSFTFESVEYALSCDYEKAGAEAKTVTFQTFNGSPIGSYKAGVGDQVTPPKAPAIPGRHFVGWSPELEEGKYTVVEGENVLKAQYDPNTITIRFNEGQGEQSYTYGGSHELPSPSKENYKFDGWKIEGKIYQPLGAQEIDRLIEAKKNGASLTAEAQFSYDPTVYTVKFHLEGGSGEAEDVTFATVEGGGFTEVVGWPKDPTREKHLFKGWYIGENRLESTDITGFVSLAEEGNVLNLHAVWEPYYTIEFQVEGKTDCVRIVWNNTILGEKGWPNRTETFQNFNLECWIYEGQEIHSLEELMEALGGEIKNDVTLGAQRVEHIMKTE